MKTVFLGGTCNESTWRDELVKDLTIGWYNPVVEDWTPDCMAEELRQREVCEICLYMITKRMTGVYSIAEVVDDSNKRPEKTVFCYSIFDGDFDASQKKSLAAVGAMVEGNGGTWVRDISDLAEVLNNK